MDRGGSALRSFTRKLVLAGLLAALGVSLGLLSVPVGGARVFPFQHAINAVAGVALGPWWAAGSALVTATLRFATGTGSIFAFPGSPFGALAVGLAYRMLRRDVAAFAEPVGTVLLGASLAALVFAPLAGLSGAAGGFLVLAGSFALSSVAGAAIGYIVLRALRRGGVLG
ncbi:energy coupling factor transporter S component ThiW [soil metagenome]